MRRPTLAELRRLVFATDARAPHFDALSADWFLAEITAAAAFDDAVMSLDPERVPRYMVFSRGGEA